MGCMSRAKIKCELKRNVCYINVNQLLRRAYMIVKGRALCIHYKIYLRKNTVLREDHELCLES